MTGIQTPRVSPSKSTHGELKGDATASEAPIKPQLAGSGKAIWIESDEDEDEEGQLAKQLEHLSVEPKPKNSSRRLQKGKQHSNEQWPNSSTHWYETHTPSSKATPTPPKYSSPAPSMSAPRLPEYSTAPNMFPGMPPRKLAPSTTSTHPWTPSHTPSRTSSRMPSRAPSTQSRASSAPSGPPPSPAPAVRGREGSFNAYVVYSGRTPYFYADWSAVKRILRNDQTLVFKGFYTLEAAQEAWLAASSSGVIAAIQHGAGRPYWSVTEGVKPAIYNSLHEAVKYGLEWGGGCLKGWRQEADAAEDWVIKATSNPSRIIQTPSPEFFP
ncbi:hypothetical protein BDP27DRAFT_1413727 [Rhodocollybia butyracea]|uniref:Ribonuclease H1 N-terminal domain-containing protein n=1 Tax=Rhodocollybia butyracea TaxID=206335 RepID=A0A9P5Q859_9AGAR|nr:hypothetical protein BDP27DRAFT_1413727 [Rhodocollybia butyracea]